MNTLRHLASLLVLAWLPALKGADAGSTPALPLQGAPPANAAAAPVPAPATPAKTKILPSALAKVSAVNVPLTPRFLQIRDRIDVLLRGRIETPPPPDPRFNPFRPPGAAPVAASPAGVATAGKEGAPSPPPAPSANDVVLLQQAVALLKVKGTVQPTGGRMQLVINSGPGKDGTYKERDIISVTVQDQPVHLRVRQITRYSVMFSLNDAEYTLKF
jgi:hypothetical protein